MNSCVTSSHNLNKNNLVLNFKRWQSVQKQGMSKFWILVFGVIITLAVLVQFPEVLAITRDEIDSIKSEINTLEGKITLVDGLISEQKKIMAEAEKTIKTKKEELRQAKKVEGKSWTGTEAVQKKQLELDLSVQAGKDARVKYLSLLKEKSDVIKRIKLLQKQTITSEVQLKIESIPNTSGQVKIIGVDLSQGCIIQIKNNHTSDCPTFLDLRKYDSSRQEVSGYFKSENGYYSRSEPVQKNSWRQYDSDPTLRIIVDPPNGMIDRIRLITIQDNFITYLLPESKKVTEYAFTNGSKIDEWNNTATFTKLDKSKPYFDDTNYSSRTIYHDRYVDKSCKQAIINADKWEILLPDTIEYMRHNCDDSFTSFEHKEVIVQTLAKHDITTSQKWKDEQRLKWIKENCLKTYGICK